MQSALSGMMKKVKGMKKRKVTAKREGKGKHKKRTDGKKSMQPSECKAGECLEVNWARRKWALGKG